MTSSGSNQKSRSIEGLFMWAVLIIILLSAVFLCLYPLINLWYSENKGPYRAITDIADLDSDGDLDVILGNTRWESESGSFAGISLWFNQGEGRFTPDDQDLPGGFSAGSGDLDFDGDADLLILDGFTLTFLLNQGGAQGGIDGQFRVKDSPIGLPVEPGHTDMAGTVLTGDLNQDGKLDGFLAGCCYLLHEPAPSELNSSSSAVVLNAWDDKLDWLKMRILPLEDLYAIPVRGIDLGDLDGDGDLDAYAAVGTLKRGGSRGLTDLVLLNDGAGNFSDSGQQLSDTGSSSVALGDLDGDGDLDALVGTFDGARAWINQGGPAGIFAAGQAIEASPTRLVLLSDLDSDGDLDALVGGKKQAVIWWNDGKGSLTQSDQRFQYSERHGLAVADFDGDGDSDIFAGAYTDDYRVWLNQGGGSFQTGEER